MQVVIMECENCGLNFDTEDNSELFEYGLCLECYDSEEDTD